MHIFFISTVTDSPVVRLYLWSTSSIWKEMGKQNKAKLDKQPHAQNVSNRMGGKFFPYGPSDY